MLLLRPRSPKWSLNCRISGTHFVSIYHFLAFDTCSARSVDRLYVLIISVARFKALSRHVLERTGGKAEATGVGIFFILGETGNSQLSHKSRSVSRKFLDLNCRCFTAIYEDQHGGQHFGTCSKLAALW
jgi:hypothetical protein